MRLALYTFGQFRGRAEDPVNAGFFALNGPIFAGIGGTPGLIAHAGYEDQPGWPDGIGTVWDWGEMILPRFYRDKGDGWAPVTLSLWTDAGAIDAFAHRGLHARAYAQRRRWFETGDWPGHVLWWIGAECWPDWAEAARRLEHLADHGATAHAFDLGHRFPPIGEDA